MPSSLLIVGGRPVRVHKAALDSKFNDLTVLTSDFWTYVDLWLRRKHSSAAIFYWSQAREFYAASLGLGPVSAPLPLYYCFLNAVKAMLEQKGVRTSPYHGTSGKSTTKKATLTGEEINFASRGVASALAQHLGDTDTRSRHSLKQILYNLAFVHRAFVLTFPKVPELFVPLRQASYVRKDGANEVWVQVETDPKFLAADVVSSLPSGFEQDRGITDKNIFRLKKRIKWREGSAELPANFLRLSTYNRRVRSHVVYIRGQPPTWYLKLARSSADVIRRSSITLMLAAMHRLSELARYDPLRLQLLMDSQQNWLLSEFLGSAPLQFVDEVATEMTGQNMAVPFVRG